jgi:hypothetical protein
MLLGGLLLVPEWPPPKAEGAGQKPFAWQRDAFWSGLETNFLRAKLEGCDTQAVLIHDAFAGMQRHLDILLAMNVQPNAPMLDVLENDLFGLAPLVAACPDRLPDFMSVFARLRNQVKRQSERWDVAAPEPRERLYRLLYGGRAAVEEAMLQAAPGLCPMLIEGENEPSATPAVVARGVTLHSGDILLSRGNAATSALIARGNDFPGNFSHVALLHVSEAGAASVIEAHIESGVTARSIEAYLQETKTRILVLRLRADLPAAATDPLLPHRAAENALRQASTRHIPYDFAMDQDDPRKQFCSEVASAAYKPLGVTLWMNMSRLSAPGLISWLSALGVRHFEAQEPSDLEYDPQLRVVAEWRDPEMLFQDHVDNAVIDVMLEGAERGRRLDYDWYHLPKARLAKALSVAKNWFGGVGRIPEGMSAATALRVDGLNAWHAALKARLLERAATFKAGRGYTPPYWELVRMAREADKPETTQ